MITGKSIVPVRFHTKRYELRMHCLNMAQWIQFNFAEGLD
jgi:hypothetical protein